MEQAPVRLDRSHTPPPQPTRPATQTPPTNHRTKRFKTHNHDAGDNTHNNKQKPGLSPTQLRDALLSLNPLDRAWVARVNAAEAQFWRRSAGVRAGPPDEILGFDCGGQQWVLEVAFPIGRLSRVGGGGWRGGAPRDVAFMKDLLKEIEARGVAAPCPIEQRWTAASASPMSPAAAG